MPAQEETKRPPAQPEQSPAKTVTVLKILQCTNLGGMEQVAYELLGDLHRSGEFRFTILTPRPFGPGEGIVRKIDPMSCDFEYRGKFGWRSFPEFRRAVSKLAETAGRIWLTGTCACSLAAMTGLKQPKILSHHYHHFEGPGSGLKWSAFYRLFGGQLKAIIYPSDFTRNEAIRIAPRLKSKMHVVRHGYTVHYETEKQRERLRAEARRELDLPGDAFIVGNAGWLIPRKRFDVFLETASRIRQKVPNAFFVICGGGPLEEELKDKAASLGLEECLRFCGWVRDLAPHYRAWDVCLFNSDFDAFGRTPLEAACHGCIAAASVINGGLKEFLHNNRNGILLDSHDPGRLANEIASLAHDPDRALAFRESAAERIREQYNPASATDIHRSLLLQ